MVLDLFTWRLRGWRRRRESPPEAVKSPQSTLGNATHNKAEFTMRNHHPALINSGEETTSSTMYLLLLLSPLTKSRSFPKPQFVANDKDASDMKTHFVQLEGKQKANRWVSHLDFFLCAGRYDASGFSNNHFSPLQKSSCRRNHTNRSGVSGRLKYGGGDVHKSEIFSLL